jgi:hypothetical protein
MPKKKRSLAWSLFKGVLLMGAGGVAGAMAIKQWDKHVGKDNPKLRLHDAPPEPAALPEAQHGYPSGMQMMAQQPVAAFVTASPFTPIVPQFFSPPLPQMVPQMMPQVGPPMPTMPVPPPPGAAPPDPAMVALAAREAKAKRKRDELDRAYKEFFEDGGLD